jgi:hypothetical protein
MGKERHGGTGLNLQRLVAPCHAEGRSTHPAQHRVCEPHAPRETKGMLPARGVLSTRFRSARDESPSHVHAGNWPGFCPTDSTVARALVSRRASVSDRCARGRRARWRWPRTCVGGWRAGTNDGQARRWKTHRATRRCARWTDGARGLQTLTFGARAPWKRRRRRARIERLLPLTTCDCASYRPRACSRDLCSSRPLRRTTARRRKRYE